MSASHVIPKIGLAAVATVDATEEDFATALVADGRTLYQVCSSTACWIKQGKALLFTSETKANYVDGETLTLSIDGKTVVFEIDKTGDGLTAAGTAAGHTVIDISADTTAAQTAARIRTAMLAAYAANVTAGLLAITDNTDGTLTIVALLARMTASDTVADATVAFTDSTALAATAGAGSMFVPAGVPVTVDGRNGQTVSILRDAADGKAHLVPFTAVR